VFSDFDIFIATSKPGTNLFFSIEIIVCLLTPALAASSSWVRLTPFLKSLTLFTSICKINFTNIIKYFVKQTLHYRVFTTNVKQTILLKCKVYLTFIHLSMLLNTSHKLLPFSVSEYSTLGGISLNCFLITRLSSASSFN